MLRFRVDSASWASENSEEGITGRLLLLISQTDSQEPRFSINCDLDSQQVFGMDVEHWKANTDVVFEPDVAGYPIQSLSEIPPGEYWIQGLLHRYELFNRADGTQLWLPMDRGEGQQWNRAPGNLYCDPVPFRWDGKSHEQLVITLDRVIPLIPPAPETKYIKHLVIESPRLSEFWGRPMHLGAHVLLPHGFDEHPDARYPVAIFHGHYPHTFDGFRECPPDSELAPEYSKRFRWEAYNQTEQEYAYRLFQEWTSDDFPRFIVVQIQHANPYYDDSYAVNSANVGPYGDAITYDLLPQIESTYRGIGASWSRFLYGGSTGGWSALAVQVMYPDQYNGCFAACPDPIDFHAYTVVDLYHDKNAYERDGVWHPVPRPGMRDHLGHVGITLKAMNQMELALGRKSRSGGQWDIWQAVYSPLGADGYPAEIWDKETGAINRDVADYWRDHFDLVHIMKRDWKSLGPKLRGKIHLYVGDMDNYYLNNAVYLAEAFLAATTEPPFDGEIEYGDRAEHCWNGDHGRPNAISRLRYHQMFLPKMVERIEATAPAGADLTSWRY